MHRNDVKKLQANNAVRLPITLHSVKHAKISPQSVSLLLDTIMYTQSVLKAYVLTCVCIYVRVHAVKTESFEMLPNLHSKDL